MATYCSQCGSQLPTNAKFCATCGASVSGAEKVMPESIAPATSITEVPSGPASAVQTAAAEAVEHPGSGGTDRKSGLLQNRVVFVLTYLAVIAPTYVLPYFGSNSGVMNLMGAAAGVGALPQFWMHVTALYFAVIVAWFRGTYIAKPWIAIFPFLAALFDMLPGFNWIFLAPTILHVVALVVGVSGEVASAARIGPWQFRSAVVVSVLLFGITGVQIKNYDAAMHGRGHMSKQNPITSAPSVATPAAPSSPPRSSSSEMSMLLNTSVGAMPDIWQVAQPPERLVQISECLLYKCGGDPWQPERPLDVFQLPDPKTSRVGSLSKGIEVVPMSAAWVTVRPGVVKVTTAASGTGDKFDSKFSYRFKRGEVVYTYASWGEGCRTVWTNGTLYGYFDEGRGPPTKNLISCLMLPADVETVQTAESEFWLRVPLANGTTGWVKPK